MEAIFNFNILRDDGNTDAWIVPTTVDTIPSLENMNEFLERVSSQSGHEVVECIAIINDAKDVLYSKGIISKSNYELMCEML